MNIKTRGFEAVQQRMAQIESKLEALNPEKKQSKSLPPSTYVPPGSLSFDKALTGALNKNNQGSMALDPVALGLIAAPTSQNGPNPALLNMIETAAERYGVDPKLFTALVKQESAFDPNAVSSAGAQGLTQLMPKTAASLGVTNPFDPAQNLDGGAKYLSQMLKQFGDTRLALAAYNAGPGAVSRANGIPPFRETQNYIDKIMANYEASSRP